MTVIEEIAAERKRQIEAEGWTPGHDDQHEDGSLAQAAACYAAPAKTFRKTENLETSRGFSAYFRVPRNWPKSWSGRWWKPKTRREDLIRAAALIVAEIERLDRITA